MSTHATTRIVGAPVPRKEGVDKLLGRAHYVDDMERDGMAHGATVRSSIPRGLIRSIVFDPRIDWSEFTIVTAADIPGKNHIQLIVADQPCLADGKVNHCEEAIVLLAHASKQKLREAVAAVHIEYDPLPPVFTIEDSERQDVIVWGADNCFKSFLLEKGDVDSAWSGAAHIVEREYRTGAQEHLYIENNGVIAEYSAESGVMVWGSLQCPYYVHKALMAVFDLPEDKVRVIQTETGGAFGGKEDYPSILAAHAALLALKSGHPVKMVYDRMEDLAATTKRHPSRTRHRTALDRDGKLLAMDIEIATDGGAYSTLSSTVLSRATLHSPGPYVCPNVRVRSRSWATNTIPYGAFRGFGAPQTIFAVERHMDEIAATLGIDRIELRRRNFLHDGDTTATEQVMREPVILDQLMDRALAESDYHARRARFARENPGSPIKRGLGVAAFYHGSGFTGSGERTLNSLAGVDVTPERNVRVLVSSTEFGQGTNTVLTQIAAEAIGLDMNDVIMAPADTGIVPNSGPTVASRTAMVVGRLIERAGTQLVAMLREHAGLGEGFSREEFFAACEVYRAAHGSIISLCRYEPPPGIFWDDQKYRGEAYPAFAWSVQVAQVAVDTVTYSAEVEEFWSVQEAGRVLNPVLAAGQIEGGVAQGIGYAL
jgi:CO/xanthine dehydrogenase Mo-binding subunit